MVLDTGHKVSAIGHGLIIAAALFAGPLFRADPEELITISNVSMITSAELEAQFAEPNEPVVQSAPSQPQAPEVAEPKVEESVAPLDPEDTAPTGQQTAEAVGQIAEQAQIGDIRNDEVAIAAPPEAPRIADQVNEAPPIDAQEAPEVQSETTPSPQAEPEPTPEPQELEETAPKESTTEIVTEADDKPKTFAPVKSIRPKGRPKDFAERATPTPQPEPSPETTPEESDQVANDILAALNQAEAENASEPAPQAAAGPPLSQGEREGLIFAVESCWNVPVAIKDARDLKVTIKVSLDREGRLSAAPVLIAPTDTSQAGVQQAYEAGRRAIIRCQPYNLPAEKYATWKEIEITFNPQKMVLR